MHIAPGGGGGGVVSENGAALFPHKIQEKCWCGFAWFRLTGAQTAPSRVGRGRYFEGAELFHSRSSPSARCNSCKLGSRFLGHASHRRRSHTVLTVHPFQRRGGVCRVSLARNGHFRPAHGPRGLQTGRGSNAGGWCPRASVRFDPVWAGHGRFWVHFGGSHQPSPQI